MLGRNMRFKESYGKISRNNSFYPFLSGALLDGLRYVHSFFRYGHDEKSYMNQLTA